MRTVVPDAVSPPGRAHADVKVNSGAWWTPVFLLAATLVTYRRFAFGPGVPGGYDTETYFFAYRQAVATAWRAGHFPLWDGKIFLGAPLFANVQAAALYPPNVMYLFWAAPQAMAASLVLHVWWSCWGMALLCRRTFAVSWTAACIGGVMFGLGGFMSAQSGHVNQVDTAAWLPWLLLCLDAAWQRRSAALAALAALIVAVQFLAGHTQESYFILAVTLAWGLWRLIQQRRDRGALVAILAVGAVALVGGAALAAIQLIPTIELTGQSIRRTGLTLGEASSFSLRPDLLLSEMLPGYAQQPDTTEHVAYVGAIGLALAGVGAASAARRPSGYLLYALAVVPLALAFGQYDPIWRFAFHHVPGFSSFRVPSRWLYVTTFALAALGAQGAASLLARPHPRQPAQVRLLALVAALAMLIAAALIALGHFPGPPLASLFAVAGVAALYVGGPIAPGRGRRSTLAAVRASSGAPAQAVPAASAPALRPGMPNASFSLGALLTVLTVGELAVAASWLDLNAPIPPQVYSDERQAVAYLQGHPNDGRVLSIAMDTYSPGDAAAITALATRETGAGSAYRTLVATKFADILTPNLSLAYGVESVDGYDGGILPLANYVALKQLFLPNCGICGNPDAILREELTAPPALAWLRLLGVGLLLDDRLQDFNSGGVAYDMTNTVAVAPGASVALGPFSPAPATTIGVITDVTGIAPAPGTAVARLTLMDAAGRQTDAVLTAGQNTDAVLGPSPVQPATGIRGVPNGHAYLATFPLGDRPWLRDITITSLLASGAVEVRAVNLHDALTQSDTAVAVAADGALQRVLSGDINLYHVTSGGAPVFLAVRTQALADDSQTAKALTAPGYPLLQQAILSYPDLGPRLSLASRALRRLDGILQGDPPLLPPPPTAAASRGNVNYRQSGTRLEATVTTDGPAYLVVKQAWYPGWRATVDGKRAPIYRADLALQAVPVPAGRHIVVVDYAPASIFVGGAISAFALVALLVVFLAGAWLRTMRGDGGTTGGQRFSVRL